MMIGVILSAGMGTRLRPLTDEIPKPLLEINDMTLLERMIKNCMGAGIREFILIVGYKKQKVYEIAPELEEKLDISIKIVENNEYNETNTSVSTYIATSLIEKQCLDEGEFVEVELIPVSKVKEMILKNEIKDAKTLVALLKYFSFYEN